jgi:hypothetical protein
MTGKPDCDLKAVGTSPANASLRETRLRYGKVLTVNPVVALWMK